MMRNNAVAFGKRVSASYVILKMLTRCGLRTAAQCLQSALALFVQGVEACRCQLLSTARVQALAYLGWTCTESLGKDASTRAM